MIVAAFVQPIRSTEDTGDGQNAEVAAMAWLDETAPELDAYSRITVNGTTFEIVGQLRPAAQPARGQ